MIYPNLCTLAAALAVYSASAVHGAQHAETQAALHRRQVGVVPPVVGAVTSSTLLTPAAVPGAAVPTPTPALPVVAPGVVPTPTPVAPITSSTAKPALPVPAVTTPVRSSTTITSSSTTKLAAIHTTPTPVAPIPTPTPTPTSTLKTTTAGGGVPALGGGGGSPQTGKPGQANVMTATVGSGGVLEYGECIAFESQCNGMCSHGVYSMNCVSGGICLCYEDDAESTAQDADPNGNAAVNAVDNDTNLASRQLPVWSASALALPVLAALAISVSLF